MSRYTHDSSYKAIFSHPEMMRDLLVGFVNESWVQELDFSTLEKVSTHFQTDDVRDRESDIIWRVKWKDDWAYIYLLLEFQSTVDVYMPIRVMSYVGLLYQDLLKSKTVKHGELLPPVFPIVLYNGEKNWQAPLNTRDLISSPPGILKKYIPKMEFLLIDENSYDSKTLNGLENLAAAIFRFERCRELEDFAPVIDDLLEWLKAPEQESLLRHVGVWIKRVLRANVTVPGIGLNPLQEARNMTLVERIDKLWDETHQRAMAEGEAKGQTEGQQAGRQAVANRLLAEGFSPDRVSSLVGISLEDVKNLQVTEHSLSA